MTDSSSSDEWTVISRQRSSTGKVKNYGGAQGTKGSAISILSSMDDMAVNIFDSVTAYEKPKKRKGYSTEHEVSTEAKDAVIAELVGLIGQTLLTNSFVVNLIRNLVDQIGQYMERSHLQQLFNYDVVILGVGKFTESYNALLQLSLSMVLHKELTAFLSKKINSTDIKVEAWIYDPVMTVEEVRICRDVLKLGVFLENTAGKIHNREGTRTIYYMPHCPYQLYCNVLWANWFELEHVYIVGNSFESYELRRALSVPKIDSDSATAISGDRNPNIIEYLLPLLKEVPLWTQAGKSGVPTDGTVTSVDPVQPGASLLTQPFARRISDKLSVTMKYYENAFCDTSLMFYNAADSVLSTSRVEELLFRGSSETTNDPTGMTAKPYSSTRLTEEEIDFLTANDVEVR